jgi:hypothetical protein
VHGPPTDARHVITWMMCTRVMWALTVATRGAFVAHVCRVVRLFPLQGCISIRISMTTSEMGDGLIAESKRSNFNFIFCDDNYRDGDDYFVVMVYDNHYISLRPLHD